MPDILNLPLSTLITKDKLPDSLTFVTTNIDDLISNLTFKNYQADHFLLEASGIYQLDILECGNLYICLVIAW